MGKPGANKSNNTSTAVANNKEYYNILFLGPTGVGKSTFINAFVNYLMYDSLERARNAQPIVLIKSKFVVTDDDLVEKEISVTGAANTSNESDVVGDSATQESMVYTFPVLGKDKMLRLIDTPGIGDTRGIDRDEINCDDILQKISRYDEIHAICILLKPNNARLTAQFEFCVKQLLSRLDKSATDNIIFVFTNSRSSFYRPGDTLPALQKLLQNVREKPPHVDIPLKRENTFCMDNEAFRFLMAMKVVRFSEDETAQFARSWDVSREVCHKLLTYIMGDENNPGLKPHVTKNTVSINEARRLIMQLAQPLADISQLICDNVYGLEQQMKELNRENQSLNDIKKNLFIPVIDIRETQFDQPRTVCAALKCSTTYMVQGKKKCHYNQRCHNPCYLRNVPREIIGSPELLHCAAMEGTKCRECGCDYGKHMHIYYETTIYETEIRDDNVASQITNREAAINKAKTLVKRMQDLKKEHEGEHEIILNTLATFAWFLKNNAITAYNDAYSTYVGYLIDREKSRGDEADQFSINHLETALRRYEEYKKILDNAKASFTTTINAVTITSLTKRLFTLKHSGKNIKSLYDGQSRAHTAERENLEYVHEVGLSLTLEPPSQQTNTSKRNSNTQQQQNNGKNAQNQRKNNNPQKKGQKNQQQQNQQGNRKTNRGNRQQNQNQWQGPPPPPLLQQQIPPPYWQQAPQRYQQGSPQNYNNYQQRPPQNYNNYQQGPPQNYNNHQQGPLPNYNNYHQNYPQGPQFNFSPGGNQQNWPNQMNQGYHQNQQQQFPPSQDQQRYQQQYNRSGPSRRNSFHNEAGPSKESTYEAPTGVYNPKAKQNSEVNTNTQSLEQQFSSMNVQEPNYTAPQPQYDNQNRNRRPRYNSNQQFHQIRGRNNFKRNQGRHNNAQQQGRNYSRNDADDNDDGENKDNSDSRDHGCREMRKNDLVKQTVALAVIEQTRPEDENSASGSSLVTVNEASPEKAVSFFRKLFR